MRVAKLAVIVATAIQVVSFSANATTISDTVAFSVTGFTSFPGGQTPVDPVTGSFSITFDDTQNSTDKSAGISLISLNLALDSALSFTYYAVGGPAPPVNFFPGELVVGGLFDGADTVQFNPSTNDFTIQILNFVNNPSVHQLVYSQTSISDDNEFFSTQDVGGTITVTPNTSPVPEPGSLFLLGSGLLGLGALRRRRSAR